MADLLVFFFILLTNKTFLSAELYVLLDGLHYYICEVLEEYLLQFSFLELFVGEFDYHHYFLGS